MSKLISAPTGVRWSIVIALASAITLTSPAASGAAAPQGDPAAEAGARPAATAIRGAKQVSNAPPVDDLKGVGEDAAEATRAAAGSQASATAGTKGEQGQTAAPQRGEGTADQSISDGRPLPAPNVDFVKSAVDSVAPMDPAQIRKFRKQVDERQAAEIAPIKSDLIPVSVTYDIDLSPGARPQVVQITPGQGALINIIDREGNGWPVVATKNYNKEAIVVESMGPSTLSIEAVSNHQIASVGVLLEGMSVAWSFTVIPAQVTTDVRVDLRLPSLSPGAVTKIGRASGLPTVGAKLDGYLYGGTPEGARRLEVTGVPGARAWQSPDGRLILRIAGLVSSPAWYERMPAADGTAVYELPATPIVAVATDGGVSHTLRIKGLQPTVAAAEKGRHHQ
ncbi:MAG: hypothetical protein E2591_26800 [Achromobacter sp.]|uniref:DotH/IcmK family type IV secretion protein n=1 Tax=Achromobacter sp. TaxID=134375 RepID=UPI0012CE8EB6|nr:DotH/IcmK family type IV secretion protein [Achromobacter sp.]MPS81688.1 hypothetical protein [Achromobacter sp.]